MTFSETYSCLHTKHIDLGVIVTFGFDITIMMDRRIFIIKCNHKKIVMHNIRTKTEFHLQHFLLSGSIRQYISATISPEEI